MAQRLLLADDSITIQKVVELVLAEEGFDIKAAGNGEEALAAMDEFRPDIVLADIDMPKMNGYQLCERIKANPATKAVPVILLAGAFEPLDEELAKNVGAEDFIIKPFESQELIGKINAVIAAEEMARGAAEEEAVEVVAEEADEDLWAMEELTAEPLVAEGFSEETPLEEASSEEIFEFAEEAQAAQKPGKTVAEEPPVVAAPARASFEAPGIELPSKEEAAEMLKEAIDGKVSSMFASLDMKDVLLTSLGPSVKDSAEKVLWEVAPELVEKLLKEMLQGALASLTKEVEKVIWETVPDLAESMISKEIERIKSEL
ncbi:MAG: response regulator [Nitrospirae bacterium]|nr:response regulator [Nitrospirota bacterium]